ncbi:MAG: hypothetical protein IJ404_07715 [Clostridia bacterium]|nr:hypothetical protein [Clostridia bacterium]
MDKPLILITEEARDETFAMVNSILDKYKLPCALYEPIFAEAHHQLLEGKRKELESAKQSYYNDIKAGEEEKP